MSYNTKVYLGAVLFVVVGTLVLSLPIMQTLLLYVGFFTPLILILKAFIVSIVENPGRRIEYA